MVSAPQNPRNDNVGVDRGAELRMRMAMEGRTSNPPPGLPPDPPPVRVNDQPCVRCGSTNVTKLFTNNFKCGDCELAFQKGAVGRVFDRRDAFAGRF
jgi:hypothetical protein